MPPNGILCKANLYIDFMVAVEDVELPLRSACLFCECSLLEECK